MSFWRSSWRVGLLAGLLLALLPILARPGAAQDATLTLEEKLAAKYAPIVVLKTQSGDCDPDGEPYVPAPVQIVLDDPAVQLRRNEAGQPVVVTGPGVPDLAGRDEAYYLDFPGNPLRPGCVYERASKERMATLEPTAHAHIAFEEGREGFALQYWLFYYFNDFNNKHEGDWEMVQLVFDATSVEEALTEEPVAVAFAQHGGGETAEWDDPKLEAVDGHPVIHVSRGSHASQYDAALYLGWGENGTGFGCDDARGPSERLPLTVVLTPDKPDPESPLGWALFQGRWGQREVWEFNGPRGPNLNDRWEKPLTWQESLREDSFAVPVPHTLGPAPTDAFCTVSAMSADLFRLHADSPWSAYGLIAVILLVPLVVLALTGGVLRAALAFYLRHARILLPIGAPLIALGLLVNLITYLLAELHIGGALIDNPASETALHLLTGVGQQVLGLTLVAPATIYAVAELRAGRRPTLRTIWRAERALLRRTIAGLFRPYLFIAVLNLIPIVGLYGFYRHIQRFFIPHAIVLEGSPPEASRTRSVAFVRGRWLRTAVLAVALTALAAIPSPLAGMILLVVAKQPVEFVNLTSSMIYAVVNPFIFVATTLYFFRERARPVITAADEPVDSLAPAVSAPAVS